MILAFFQVNTGERASEDNRQMVWFEGKDREECMAKARIELQFEKCEEVDSLIEKSWESDEDSISEDLYDFWHRICGCCKCCGHRWLEIVKEFVDQDELNKYLKMMNNSS